MKRSLSNGDTNRSALVSSGTTPRANIFHVSPYTLLKMVLIGGIFAFAIGTIVTYSHLMKIESNNNRRGNRIGSVNRSYDRHRKVSHRHKIPSLPDLDSLRGDESDNQIIGRALGAEKGRVKCDQDVYRLVSYWSDPRSNVDRSFHSPFLEPPFVHYRRNSNRRRYLSFEPDQGGWNNIRMQFEIMVVLAAATGRTIVLPPDNPMYLLNKEKENRHRGLQKFFQSFDDIVDTITMEDFFQEEIIRKKSYPLPSDERNRTRLIGSLQKCYWIAKSESSCIYLGEYLTRVADFVPDWHGEHDCLIMDDENWFRDEIENVDDKQQQQVKKFCDKRKPVYYNAEIHDAPLLHFHSHTKLNRLLVHYYAFLHFTNPKVGNYYKRLVRDRVRYPDRIFCAAGKIVKSLSEESVTSGSEPGYFSMHIRRGDFQWPKMRLSAEEWYENTRSWLEPDADRLLYIATDESNRTFFDPLRKHYKVRFLDDYAELVGLSQLDPNFAGMIDQVVASRSTVFVGTYFSSFSAFIGRMRAYHGLSGNTMYYSHPERWNETHSWVYPHSSYSAREYPIGWVGIDKDDEPSEKDFY